MLINIDAMEIVLSWSSGGVYFFGKSKSMEGRFVEIGKDSELLSFESVVCDTRLPVEFF